MLVDESYLSKPSRGIDRNRASCGRVSPGNTTCGATLEVTCAGDLLWSNQSNVGNLTGYTFVCPTTEWITGSRCMLRVHPGQGGSWQLKPSIQGSRAG